MDDIKAVMGAEGPDKKTNWDHSREIQGPRPRKTMVNLWFVHGTETSRNVRKVLSDKDYKANGEAVRASLELSPPRKPLWKAQAMFFKALYEVRRDENKIWLSW